MQDSEMFSKILKEGETMRWSGTPRPYGLFDETHKTSTLISLCWALAWGILLVGGYYALSVSQGQEIRKGVMFFCAIIPIMVACGPITDKGNIKKLRYPVTDKRLIITSAGETGKECAMDVTDVDEWRVEKTANGNCHVRIGSKIFKASARKLISLATHGDYDMKGNDKIYKGLVLYNLSAEDGDTIYNILNS